MDIDERDSGGGLDKEVDSWWLHGVNNSFNLLFVIIVLIDSIVRL